MRYVVLAAFGLATALAAACSSFDDGDAPAAVDAGQDVAIAPPPGGGDAGAQEDGDAGVPPPFSATDAGTRCEDFDDPKSGVLPFTNGERHAAHVLGGRRALRGRPVRR